jgi:hypothetical protein
MIKMTSKQKADELYHNAIKLHGSKKAKQESLKSAEATYALAPYSDRVVKSKDYWKDVIDCLNKNI